MHVHLILDLRFSLFLLPLLLHSLLIITIPVYGATIWNWQLAHSVADGKRRLLHPISPGHVLFSLEPPTRYFTADNPRLVHGGDAYAEVRAVYIPAVIANAFYAPANIAGSIAWAR